MLDIIYRELSSSPFGISLGVFGIFSGVYFYFTSKQSKTISVGRRELAIIGGKSPEFDESLEIRFDGKPVPRVTLSRIVLWNSGNRTIDARDLVERDPLRIELEDGDQILKVNTLRESRSVNAFEFLKVSERTLKVKFDFIDPHDGITFEVLHTSTIKSLEVLGTIKGQDKKVQTYDIYRFLATDSSPVTLVDKIIGIKTLAILTAVISIAMIVFSLFPEYKKTIDEITGFGEGSNNKEFWIPLLLGAFYFFGSLFMLWTTRRRFPATLNIETKPNQNSNGIIFAAIERALKGIV